MSQVDSLLIHDAETSAVLAGEDVPSQQTGCHLMSTVFIVDDQPIVAESTVLLLQSDGHEVERVATWEQLPSKRALPPGSCFVFDMWMPDLTGTELLLKLQVEGYTTPCIVTGTEVEMEASALQAGAWAFLLKPYHADLLLRSVQTAVCR